MWRWARAGVCAYLVLVLAQLVLEWVLDRRFWSSVWASFRTMLTTPNARPPTYVLPNETRSLALLSNALYFGTVAVAVVFLVWQHSAASTARDLGYPARRSPALGVGSWFIPVVGLWFPYQALRDCLLPGHPARPSSLTAWLAHISGGVLLSVAVLTTLLAGLYGLIPLALSAGCFGAAARIGTRLIKTIREDHRLAVARRQEHVSGGAEGR